MDHGTIYPKNLIFVLDIKFIKLGKIELIFLICVLNSHSTSLMEAISMDLEFLLAKAKFQCTGSGSSSQSTDSQGPHPTQAPV